VRKRLERVWNAIRQVLAVRGLLQWLGLGKHIPLMLTGLASIALGIWGYLRGLPGPIIAFLVIVCFFFLTLTGAIVLNLVLPKAPSPSETKDSSDIDSPQCAASSPPTLPTLPERARQLAKELDAFINTHSDSRGPDVYKINFLYAAHFRDRVDKMLNELAAEQILDVFEDWEINPQTQTARNIRSNIIDRLESLANRLEIKTSKERLNKP
jgi:hypothetical protein